MTPYTLKLSMDGMCSKTRPKYIEGASSISIALVGLLKSLSPLRLRIQHGPIATLRRPISESSMNFWRETSSSDIQDALAFTIAAIRTTATTTTANYSQGPSGNVDLAVLRPEKQNRTHVTPLIDKLARGLFREHLEVVGPRPKRLDERVLKQQALEARLRLLDMLARTMNDRRKIEFPHAKQLQHRDRVYWVGDVVLTQAGSYRDRRVPDVPTDLDSLPDDATLPDFFWFARIIYIDQQRKKLHVQWFEHSSQTFLQEIGNPQELFLFKTCDHVDIKLVVGKVKVHRLPAMEAEVGPLDYFYNFVYDEADASFTSVNDLNNSLAESLRPPNNCPACLIFEQQSEDDYGRKIDNGRGVAYRGERYHEHDFAVIQTEDGPAQIGQIMDIRFSSRARQLGSTVLTVRVLGRTSDIIDIFPRDRHLFFTDEVADVSVADLVHRCSVRHYLSVSDLSKWLAVSPFHFYTKYHFPSLDVNDWDDRTELLPDNIPQCMSCSEEDEKRVKQLEEFMRRRRPLRALDPFGGVGAFGLGMEESGCIKMTHAVEISPSAAETLRRNSPGTLVYNQCSNIVLRRTKAIMWTFPRVLEMANSYRDKPQLQERLTVLLQAFHVNRIPFCYMENVRGFLSYNLNTTQAGRYRVEGGIKMGGLKFLVRALLAMGYQVHFSLLQAAHYGTPQSRVRFFLIAALHGHTLPAFPQPTHDFPLHDALELKFPNGISIRPIRTANGLAPCKFVSIDDAIGDLPRFDWKNPRKLELSTRQYLDDIPEEGHRNIPAIACDRSKPYCGPAKTEPYHHRKPLTSFQVRCRIRPTTDLQHFTRVLKEETVERVVNIPLNPKADYKSLNPYLWEWQFSNPSSAVARDGFRPGLYGRLDKDGWFQTTVTNVEPTAKQSWVLNPYCKRVVTVRELARSQGFPDHFVFYSMHSDVKTMQRQIGNAVPWPVAAALGRELRQTLFRQWQRDQEEAIVVE
ncbi:DNA (cytosine-5)-methyltransferase 1B [Grifola frondosa]|uniref:DNA (cytosine-5-)-methyltransferase n=1 Tax=Grifola frondosa TaxID=5627 RepID=A0A1C7LUN5_GRIFR|nr:DNA (cytosine-5)-methyltransferase 1B [Grifola frondosa]